jgi:hypothetical protein
LPLGVRSTGEPIGPIVSLTQAETDRKTETARQTTKTGKETDLAGLCWPLGGRSNIDRRGANRHRSHRKRGEKEMRKERQRRSERDTDRETETDRQRHTHIHKTDLAGLCWPLGGRSNIDRRRANRPYRVVHWILVHNVLRKK